MNLFSQIIPRLSRNVSPTGSTETAPEYALKPVYEVKESPEVWNLTVHLPGVTREGLEITAEEGQLTIRGQQAWKKPVGWTALYRESAEAPFLLKIQHDNALDIDHIQAELKDGVLRATLPKAEALKPRKISVN